MRWEWIKNLHQPGLHGGSLHSWQTGWWRVGSVGRSLKKKRKKERGHRYTAIGRKSNEEERGWIGTSNKRRERERTEAEESRKIGREKSVYSGKCMKEGWGGHGRKQLEGGKKWTMGKWRRREAAEATGVSFHRSMLSTAPSPPGERTLPCP